ncbi:MAG TPA: metallophosphoesterase, partial [Bacteroidota bacterium]|nr:metallophosphoesterase [Bacteroidota bacterium]
MIHRNITRISYRLSSVLLAALWWTSGVLAQAPVRFAIVGDYGDTPPNSGNVAALIQSWTPDFVITTGDNNYTNPTPAPPNHYPAWDGAVGQYYHQFIRYPAGSGSAWAGSGSATNKFFPSVGNHDWDAGIAGWESYFELPGNERYYDFVEGPVHFFVISSDPREPDEITAGSVQGQWLQTQLAASTSPWNIVYFHHPPYTSAARGNNTALQWPFQSWGADAVLNGHEHHYERIMKNGFPYMVCGAGGRSLNGFATVEPGSVIRYNSNWGALRADATVDSVVFRFYAVGGTLIDTYVLGSIPTVFADTILVPVGSVWKYLADGSNQGTAWRDRVFDDSVWPAGPAELGYGDASEGRPEATVVNCGLSAPACNSGNFITTYFRRSFSILDSSIYAGLTLRLLRDDGAAVYLNDLEIFRSNMPTGTITSSTAASSAVGGGDESAWFSTIVDPTNLRTGVNVLAVEIHQSSATSSDVSFDLQLIGSIVQNTPFRETFESVTTPSSLNAHPEWRDGTGGPTVNAGIGVNGSNGLTNADSIFTWEAIPFSWNASSFQGAVFQMDFQSSATAPFLDDDRIGWMITNTTAASVNFFGVQLDPDAAGTGQNIEMYWDNQSNTNVRTTITNTTGLLQATTWYRLRLEVTKLGAAAAQLDVLLTQLDASGNPVRVVATGFVP